MIYMKFRAETAPKATGREAIEIKDERILTRKSRKLQPGVYLRMQDHGPFYVHIQSYSEPASVAVLSVAARPTPQAKEPRKSCWITI
jgi:hypothetical protein